MGRWGRRLGARLGGARGLRAHLRASGRVRRGGCDGREGLQGRSSWLGGWAAGSGCCRKAGPGGRAAWEAGRAGGRAGSFSVGRDWPGRVPARASWLVQCGRGWPGGVSPRASWLVQRWRDWPGGVSPWASRLVARRARPAGSVGDGRRRALEGKRLGWTVRAGAGPWRAVREPRPTRARRSDEQTAANTRTLPERMPRGGDGANKGRAGALKRDGAAGARRAARVGRTGLGPRG